jgi:8-oxo-dGTP pyrophosphatase MutT (NUDIX family)
MDIEQIRSALTSEIYAVPMSELIGKQLSSVLIIIYGNDPFIIMTKKARNLKIHAGEVAFPGGKWCEKETAEETAIRETNEELGLRVSKEQIIGQLDNVITLNSNYNITPFVAILDEAPTLVANSEVESILHIPLVPLLNTMDEDKIPEHRSMNEMYTFTFEKHIIWGASARMLRQIFMLLSEKKLL